MDACPRRNDEPKREGTNSPLLASHSPDQTASNLPPPRLGIEPVRRRAKASRPRRRRGSGGTARLRIATRPSARVGRWVNHSWAIRRVRSPRWRDSQGPPKALEPGYRGPAAPVRPAPAKAQKSPHRQAQKKRGPSASAPRQNARGSGTVQP